MITLPEIIEIDLPTLIVLIVLWLLDYFQIRALDRKLDELKKTK